MNVTLKDQDKKFIAEQLKSGHYHSAADVVAESLGMLRAQEDFIRSNVPELREKIAVGRNQFRRGEVVDSKIAIKHARANLRRRERAGK